MAQELVRTFASQSGEDLDHLPLAIDMLRTFATHMFILNNPQAEAVSYVGPRDHETIGGSKHPTHLLEFEIVSADFHRRISIADYRGKSIAKPREDFRVDYAGDLNGRPFKVSMQDDVSPDRIGGISGLPSEFDIFRGLHVAVFLHDRRFGLKGVSFQYNTSSEAEDLLRRLVLDFAGLDFSESPLLPLRNEPRAKLRGLGAGNRLPPLPEWQTDDPSWVIY